MYSIEFYLDYVGNVKKNITRKIINDPTLLDASEKFIDAQVSWAKSIYKVGCNLTKYSAESITKVWFPQNEKQD